MRATMGVKVKFHKGAWWVFINHHGRRRAKMIGDKETAHTVARRIRERLTLGDLSLLTSEPAESFETYAARWLTAGESARKASTHRFYAFNLTLHIKPTLGARPISAITRADCRELLAACRQKGLKRASLLGVQRTLSAVLSQAVEDQILAANPAFRMGKHMRMGDEPKPEIQPLTHVEAFDFLVAVTERMPEQYRVLPVRAPDWDAPRRAAGAAVGRCRFRRPVPRGPPQPRIRPAHDHEEHEPPARRYVAEAGGRAEGPPTRGQTASLKAGRKLPSWVFTTPEGGHLDGDNVRNRVFYRLLESASLRQIRFHDLRHTFASLLIQNGEPLTYVKEQMGHSSIQVTVEVYGHLVPSANRAAVDRLDAQPTRNPGATGEESADPKADAK